MADTRTRRYHVSLTRNVHWATTITAHTTDEAVDLARGLAPDESAATPGYVLGPWNATAQVMALSDGPVPWAIRLGLAQGHLVPRPHELGRYDVTDSEPANTTFGCPADDDCILNADHWGPCNADRITDLAGGESRPARVNHGVLFSLCTDQGTAMSETTLCWQHTGTGLSDSINAALLSGDADPRCDWQDTTQNPEVECTTCGLRGTL